MSDDSTRSTSGDVADHENDRLHRAAELTAQAQALFSTGVTSDGTDSTQASDETDDAADEASTTTDAAGEADEQHASDQPDAVDEPDADDAPEGTSDDDADAPDVPVVAVMAHEAADDGDDDAAADSGASEPDGPRDAENEQADDEQAVDGPGSSFPSFGVVFQAPDLSDIPRRRSRRATSGVTTPQERPADQLDQEPAPAQEQAAQDRDPSQTDEESDADDAGSRAGRRRRRGGKGRRGRGATGEQGDESADEDQDDDNQSDQAASATVDEAQQDEAATSTSSRRSRRGRRPAAQQAADQPPTDDAADTGGADNGDADDDGTDGSGTRRRRRRRRTGEAGAASGERSARDEVTSVKGSTRLEAKRQRRREGREAGRRRTIITEAEFLARRESVDRVMVVRGLEDRTQIAVLEDGVPVEHYVSRSAQSTMVGNVYLGRVQNVLPSMEAAFVDIGKGRNAVLYAGEVNWDAAGMSSGEPKRIENALKAGGSVLVQVTKDPVGHKGARLTSQISLPGRYLVYVPGNSMTGISRKLPDTERTRLKKILKEVVPADAGVIVRTAAEGASEAELRADVERLTTTWERIQSKPKSANAPVLLHGEPDMTVRVIRDVFTEDFSKLVVSGDQAWTEVKRYIDDVAPDLADRVEKYTGTTDVFSAHRVHEAISKAMDRKVWLPSGGSLVIDRTEAMTVVDVNTGKFTGSGGNLEETVTKNNIEAAEEIVRQLRLRDIGGIIVIDFIDMVLESNRDLVVRRLLECLGRDRTKHQVAEVTSLGLVQMTRKRVGAGLIEVFSEPCAHCNGRGVVVETEPVHRTGNGDGGSSDESSSGSSRRGRGKSRGGSSSSGNEPKNVLPTPKPNGPTPAQIAAAAHAAALQAGAGSDAANAVAQAAATEVAAEQPLTLSPEHDAAGQEAGAQPTETEERETQVDVTPEATTLEATTLDEAGTQEAPVQDGPAQEQGAQEVAQEQADQAAAEGEPTATGGRSRKRAAKSAQPRSGTRRGSAKSAAEVQTDASQTDAPQTDAPQTEAPEAVADAPAPATDAAGTTAAQEPAAEAPAPAPKRRRRGRVVAPAGPPTGGPETAVPGSES